MTSIPIVTRFWRSLHTTAPAEPRPPLNLHTLWNAPDRLPTWVQGSPLVLRYLDLLGPLDWEHFPERDLTPRRGMPPVPFRPFVAACLVKLDQGIPYFSGLRRYLVDHPALTWTLGFPVTPSRNYDLRVAVDQALPTQRHFPRLLRKIPNEHLQYLLAATVRLLRTELSEVTPDFGKVVALDTKHILAWVRENNPRTYVKDRFDKNRQPAADPDCRLGCKRKHNQRASAENAPPTPTADPVPADTLAVGEYYWGYASGIVTTKVHDWGEFVLAELTLPFNEPDVAYFFPLMDMTARHLGFRPLHGALDAAYDAHYVYEYFHRADGIGFAAVPLVSRGGSKVRHFAPNGLPLCDADLAMPLKHVFFSKSTRFPHERARYACPLVFPEPTGKPCPLDHKKWKKGGCVTTMATSVGARIRYQLDRESELYQWVYDQRTATERLFSLAKELGIERPKLRNGRAIANLNTLIYVLLNLRALQRVKALKLAREAAK